MKYISISVSFLITIMLFGCTEVYRSDDFCNQFLIEFISSEGTINEKEEEKEELINLMKDAIINKSNQLNEMYPAILGDDAKVAFCDINRDGYPEVLWSIVNYRHNDIYWFIYNGDSIIVIDNSMITTYCDAECQSPIVDIYCFPDKILVKTSWLDWSYKLNYRFFEFYEIKKNDIIHTNTLCYKWLGKLEDEIPTKFYLNGLAETEVSEIEFYRFMNSLMEGKIMQNSIAIDTNITKYMEGNNLEIGLYNAYEKFMQL